MTRFSRRDVLKIGLGSTAALALGARPVSAGAAMKATQVTSVLYAAHLVAETNGLSKTESVEVDMLTSPQLRATVLETLNALGVEPEPGPGA